MAPRPETATTKVYIDGQSAEATVKELTAQMRQFNREMKIAKENGDHATFLKLAKQADEAKRQLKELKNAAVVYDNVLKNLSGVSLKELERAQKQITKELRSMAQGTDDFAKKSKQLGDVSRQIQKVKSEMKGLTIEGDKGGGFNFEKIGASFTKYFSVITTMAAAFTGVGLSVRFMIDSFNEFESGAAELSAITQLTGSDLEYLKDQAKQMSVSVSEDGVRITQSATDILKAFQLMGGAKAELLQDKEALAAVTKEALILAEAAKMETAVAVESLATTMNQFGASADQARRYVNALAAGSTAGAAEVDDIAQSMVKMGTVANQANISVEESVALLETLADKGVKAEVAGTQLRAVLLKLQTGADEYNPKVVGMAQALDNLAAANLTAEQRVKMFGLESVVAGNILIDNRDRFRELTTAVTGTNTAYEQAAVNTSTNTAELKQAQNQMKLNAIELGERLSPALTEVTGIMGKFLGALVDLVKWGERNAATVRILVNIVKVAAAAYAGYMLAVRAAWLEQKIDTAMKAAGIAKTQALAVAQALLSGNLKKAKEAMIAFNAASKVSPWGIALGVITAVAAAIYTYRDEIFKTQKVVSPLAETQDLLNVKLEEETEKLTQLKEQLKLTEPGSRARRDILKEITEKYPELLKNMNVEKATLSELTGAIDAYIQKLGKKIEMEILEDQVREVYRKKEELARQDLTAYEKAIQERDLDYEKSVFMERLNRLKTETDYGERYVQLLDEQRKLMKDIAGLEGMADQQPMTRSSYKSLVEERGGTFEDKAYTTYLQNFRDNNTELAAAKQRMEQIQKEIAEALKKKTEADGKGGTGTGTGAVTDEEKKKAEEALKTLAEWQKKVFSSMDAVEAHRRQLDEKELDDIRTKYNEEILLAEAYRITDAKHAEEWAAIAAELVLQRNAELNVKREEQERRFAEKLWQVRKELGLASLNELRDEEIRNLQQKLDEQLISSEDFEKARAAIMKKYQDMLLKEYQDFLQKQKEAREKWGIEASTEEQKAAELEALKADYESKLLTYEEYLIAQTILEKKYIDLQAENWRKKFQLINDQVQQYGQASTQIISAVSDYFTSTKEDEIAAVGDNEAKKKEIQKKHADAEMGINIAKIGVSTGLAVMNSLATVPWPVNIAMAAAAGITGGVQIALAVRERNKIKGFRKGLYPVTDTQGETYQAAYGGYARTGMVNEPTVFLAGEDGRKGMPEMIIDGPTFRNIQMNAPEALAAIYQNRAGYEQPGRTRWRRSEPAVTQSRDDKAMLAVLSRLSSLLEKGVKAKVVKRDLDQIEQEDDELKTRFQ